ncbi:alanine:cation symporter family protein, partial [Salmonella enterica subsp. enterica serovar Kentucky]|nr:alanine:cation symporter family protein [Salmonella enterica subsp. enterica serovar Kentucky]
MFILCMPLTDNSSIFSTNYTLSLLLPVMLWGAMRYGYKFISMQWLIPIIALLWVAGSVFICLWHIEQMPGVIASIVKSAFGWQ